MRNNGYCFHCKNKIKLDIKNKYNVAMGGVINCFSCDYSLDMWMIENQEKLEKIRG